MSDLFYRLGRTFLDTTIRLYYRRIEVAGGERIPASGPAVLVANHPNSVPDAFLLASRLTRRKPNFIATDTITRMPVLGWLVRQLGVVGVARAAEYQRQRDLARQLNQRAIHTCVPRLRAGELVVIFGEGISTDARKLHVIRKGAMRFGYAAEQEAGFKLGLVWIPVGLNYSAKQRFRSDVLIQVGEPFGLADLHPHPAEHEAEVLQSGTARLQRDLESLVVNIEREELAGLIDRLAELLGNAAGPLAPQIERHQRLAQAVHYFNATEPQRLVDLERTLRRYHRRLAATGLSDEVVRQRHPRSALWANFRGVVKNGALMLLNLYGWANSFVPRWTAYLLRPAGARVGRFLEPADGHTRDVTRLALWATFGGWLGAAVAFPLQTYLVLHWAAASWGFEAGVGVALLYGLSLIPSWQLYIRRRDVFRYHLARMRDAVHFLLKAGPATRLQGDRRRLQRRLRELLAAYAAAGPRAA